MIDKEQIAHDLTMVYMRNRYGIDVAGSFSFSENENHGQVSTEHLPSPEEADLVPVITKEKKFFKRKTIETIQKDYKIDSVIADMTKTYLDVYKKFYDRL